MHVVFWKLATLLGMKQDILSTRDRTSKKFWSPRLYVKQFVPCWCLYRLLFKNKNHNRSHWFPYKYLIICIKKLCFDMCFTKTVYNRGETALERFPELRDKIMSVVEHGSFEIVDLKWISECLGMQIRLTVDPSIYENVRDHSFPNLPRDCIFGPTSPQLVHLYYSWTQSVADPAHVFGHYDALPPCTPALILTFCITI